MATISQILLEKGRQQSAYRQRRGEMLSGVVQGLAQIPGQILQDRRAQAAAEAQAARQQQTDARADTETDIRVSAEQRMLDEATGRRTAAADSQASEQRGKQAVMGWVKQHGHKLQPQEAEGILAAIELPGGVAKALEVLTRAPDGMKLQSIDPTRPLVDMNTGTTVREGVPAEPEPKFREVIVKGPNGRPMKKLVPESELMQGVEQYQEPRGTGAPEPLVPIIGKDGQSVLVPRSQAVGQRPASSREQGRPVTSGDAGRIAELDTSLDDVAVLTSTVSGNNATGTRALIGSKVPNWATELTGWGTDAKKKNAVIARVKQVIGKALEGGVLRKEDEVKYKDILPTIGDVPDVVATKLEGLAKAIELRRQRELEAREDAGYDVSKFKARTRTAPKTIGRFEVQVSD